jgi:putative hydrolase of the HAD superfamily
MNSAMRAFLFDIGNVLVRFDFSKAIRALAAWSDVADEREALQRIDTVKLQYEDGQMPRADFLHHAFTLLRYRGTEAQFIAAWQNIFTANEPMHALVRQLHGRHPLYLLSNTNDMHVEGLFRDFPVFSCFTGGTYSHEVRASKPHAAIYEIACRTHGLVPAETFFIDDLADNITAARQLGFQTHQYHPDRHEDLLKSLRAAGMEIT